MSNELNKQQQTAVMNHLKELRTQAIKVGVVYFESETRKFEKFKRFISFLSDEIEEIEFNI